MNASAPCIGPIGHLSMPLGPGHARLALANPGNHPPSLDTREGLHA